MCNWLRTAFLRRIYPLAQRIPSIKKAGCFNFPKQSVVSRNNRQSMQYYLKQKGLLNCLRCQSALIQSLIQRQYVVQLELLGLLEGIFTEES